MTVFFINFRRILGKVNWRSCLCKKKSWHCLGKWKFYGLGRESKVVRDEDHPPNQKLGNKLFFIGARGAITCDKNMCYNKIRDKQIRAPVA